MTEFILWCSGGQDSVIHHSGKERGGGTSDSLTAQTCWEPAPRSISAERHLTWTCDIIFLQFAVNKMTKRGENCLDTLKKRLVTDTFLPRRRLSGASFNQNSPRRTSVLVISKQSWWMTDDFLLEKWIVIDFKSHKTDDFHSILCYLTLLTHPISRITHESDVLQL